MISDSVPDAPEFSWFRSSAAEEIQETVNAMNELAASGGGGDPERSGTGPGAKLG